MMTQQNDVLVEEYLSRVTRATAGLPEERRDELMRDLREHIEAARSELTEETEAQVRQILDRLGDPIEIAHAAAAENTGPVPVAPVPVAPVAPARSSSRRTLWIIAAVVAFVVLVAFCGGAMVVSRSDSGPAEAPRPMPPVSAVP